MKDKFYRHKQYSQVIEKQSKVRPFSKIKCHKKRSVYILYCSGLPGRSISEIMSLSERYVWQIIAEGKRLYPEASALR